jgi:muramoyltetrapeptide carboxypeptidase
MIDPTRRRLRLLAPAYSIDDEAWRLAQQQGAQLAAELRLDWCGPARDGRGAAGTWAPLAIRHDEALAAWDDGLWWCQRGGHGCVELAGALARGRAQRAPLLIGFSDVTALHALWWRRGWGVSLHGPMAARALGPRGHSSLLAHLRGQGLRLDAQADEGLRSLHGGRAAGPLFAGCLTVLAATCGTRLQPDLRGAIVALEDVDEAPYRVDRCLQQLRLAGVLDGIAGLVLGRFPCETPHRHGPDMDNILAAWAQRLAVPCVAGLAFGHERDPWTLACGAASTLDADTRVLVQSPA